MDSIAEQMDPSQEQRYLVLEDQHFLLRDILVSAYGAADNCHSNGNHFSITALFAGEYKVSDDCSYQRALSHSVVAAMKGARYVLISRK